jgi:hypothetical protein
MRRGPHDTRPRKIADWRFSLYGVKDAVGPEYFDGFDESEAAMKAEPFSGVAMPLNVEAITAYPVEAGKWGIELLAQIIREAGAITLDEAILGAVPFAENIDWIVELCRPDRGQESRLQELSDQPLAGLGDAGLFGV